MKNSSTRDTVSNNESAGKDLNNTKDWQKAGYEQKDQKYADKNVKSATETQQKSTDKDVKKNKY